MEKCKETNIKPKTHLQRNFYPAIWLLRQGITSKDLNLCDPTGMQAYSVLQYDLDKMQTCPQSTPLIPNNVGKVTWCMEAAMFEHED